MNKTKIWPIETSLGGTVSYPAEFVSSFLHPNIGKFYL